MNINFHAECLVLFTCDSFYLNLCSTFFFPLRCTLSVKPVLPSEGKTSSKEAAGCGGTSGKMGGEVWQKYQKGISSPQQSRSRKLESVSNTCLWPVLLLTARLSPAGFFPFFFLPSIAWTLIIEWAYLCSQSCLHRRKELPRQLWMQMSIILQVGKRRQRCGNKTESWALSAGRGRYENGQKSTINCDLCRLCWIKCVCCQSTLMIKKKKKRNFFLRKMQRFRLRDQWGVYAKLSE